MGAESMQEAVIEFTNVLKLDPKDARVHYKLALAYLKQGDLPHLQKPSTRWSKALRSILL
jgi:Tfp pilus assembly protein PilF